MKRVQKENEALKAQVNHLKAELAARKSKPRGLEAAVAEAVDVEISEEG